MDRDQQVFLQEVYRINDNLPIVKKPVGSWRPGKIIKLIKDFIWTRRSNLQGTAVTATVVHVHNYTNYLTNEIID